MNEENKKAIDAQGEEFNLLDDDFTFVQKDEKIHDSKFETKPTTFTKDALKRFCKNKSSVVAFFIIGIIMLLSFVVPLVSNANVDENIPSQRLLEPKLFSAGTGFWDGTTKFKDMTYDVVSETPVGFKKTAVIKTSNRVDKYTSTASENAHGGSFKIVCETGSSYKYVYNYTAFPLKAVDNVVLDISFSDVDNLNGRLGEYQIYLSSSYSRSDTRYALTSLLDTYEDFHINLSEYITNNSISDMDNAYIQIDLKQDSSSERYILIDSITFTTDSDDADTQTLFETLSLSDAAAQCMLEKDTETNKFPDSYWRSTGRREVYNAIISKIDFVYDYYEDQLGYQEDFEIGQSLLDQYIANGWCSYDASVGIESFVKLSEKCPIEEITAVDEFSSEYMTSTNYICNIIMYKYLGYSSMPKFILGTDITGRDLFTYSLKALSTSLLLAFIVSAVNFIIGLVWGSVSGYFGGNVDLFMERFCEILSGVPFVVVITLTILLLGNNLVTFAIALTLTGWMGIAGTTRTQFYRFKGREYVLAARTLGASDKRLIFKHILPNSLGTIVTSAVLMIPGVIFSEASIAYLGLGLKGVDSFGVLLSNYQSYYSTHPMLIIFPSVIISLLMISFNLFGNGLRDALNPSLKGSE